VTNAFDPDRDNQIARLLKLAGRRPAPGADSLVRARDAARAEWRQVLQVRARRRLLKAIVAAAIIGAVGGAAWMWAHRAAPVDRSEIATLQKVIGTVHVSEAALENPAALASTNRRIRAGDRLETTEGGGAALQFFGGPSVRLHAATAVTFESADRLKLNRGTLYVDSDPRHARRALVIVTALGTVRHLGTQFEVVLRPGSLDVRVREGEVSIESGSERLTAAAGEALRLEKDQPVERRRIGSSGPDWAWIGTMAAPFTLEGSTIPAFLQWVSREDGLRWEYADAAARRVADRAVLHGSIEGLTPAEALLAVLPAAGLTSTRDGDRLIIRAAAG
jgi:ferric-dicitrate binding protein FerR (iron transport regulator)